MQANEQPPLIEAPNQPQPNTAPENPPTAEEFIAIFFFLAIKQILTGVILLPDIDELKGEWVLPELDERSMASLGTAK